MPKLCLSSVILAMLLAVSCSTVPDVQSGPLGSIEDPPADGDEEKTIAHDLQKSAASPWYDDYDFASKDCVAYWPFASDSLDYSGNANDGAMTGGAFEQDALHLMPGEYVTVPHSDTIADFDSFTLSCWVKLNMAPPDNEYVMGKGTDGMGPLYVMLAGIAGPGMVGTLDFVGVVHDGSQATSTGNGVSRTIGEWHHVAVTYDGSVIRKYVDCILAGETSCQYGVLSTNPNHPLYFNRHDWPSGWSSRLNMCISEAAIFNRALSNDEVADLASDTDADGIADFWGN